MKKLLRLISVATMLLAATTFMACSSDDDDDDSGARSVSARTSGSIVGVVLDNKGEPVEGATVTLGGKTAKTNYGGEFEITGVNPNDSKLIKAAKIVTTTSTESTKAGTGTGASTTPTDTSHSTTSTTGDGTVETEVKDTGYTLTVKKDGYLSGKVTGIYVTYQDTEDPEVTRANALLHGLEFDYQDILDRYAGALTNANANNGGAVGTTATTTTTATEDTTATTTVQTGSNADRVFKDISEAISALKSLYKTGSYTEYFSTFGTTTTPLIPLDASLKGKIKLNLKTRTGTTYDEKTYTPKSNPTVHVSYKAGTFNLATGATTSVQANAADYTWEAKVDSDGNFVFDKCLPSGVPLSITVDSFEEKITKEGATEAEAYWFSSASQVIYAETTGATANSTTTTVTTTNTNNPDGSTTTKTEEIVASDASITSITLGSKDANEKSYLIMLFAQNDKVWVTKTNVEPTANGTLLTKNDALTFTFNKTMKKVGASATGISNLTKDAYTATLSDDKKTVTFTPNIGYWILSGTSQSVTLTVEAEDGATTLLKRTFPVYFDNKVWVSVKDLSYNDYNDLRKLSDPIVLVFSKPMNEKIAVNLTNNKTAYTEKWNEADADKGIEANTELTLTPDAKVGYWDIGSEKTIDITVADAYANSKDSYINEFGYWKVGADTTGSKLTVNFDNYNDVTIAKADKGFTATFAKAIKAQTESELKANLHVYNASASYSETFAWGSATELSDVILALSDDGTTITVTPQNTEFANYGYYALKFDADKFVAKTGEKILRKPATTKTVEDFTANTTPFVTTFTLGTEFKYTAVTVVDKLPETALASRAIYVDNDKYLKITFNKAVRSSKLSILASKTATAPATPNVTNYIDGNDVYLPLASRSDDDVVIVKGDVLATNGDKWTLGNEGFDTLYKVNKLSYKMVETSLYTVKKAIAEGGSTTAGNDALVNKIAPAETTITFTFDQNVEGATWTAEFYDSDNVKFKNLDQTPYEAKAAAAGKVVTVTLSGKDRDFGKVYYLSLKATKGTGDDVVVLYDSSKASAYGPLPGRAAGSTATLDSAIIATVTISGSNTQKYIHVDTKSEDEVAGLDNLYVVEASNNKASKTTSFDDFAKSNASQIVLEFSENIEAIVDANEVYLAKALNYVAPVTTPGSEAPASGWLKKDDVNKADTYAAKATVAGKVLTITPTFVFASEAEVYPIVFKKDGTRLVLKNVKDSAYLTKSYKALKWTSDKEVSDVIEAATASTAKALEFKVFNKLEIGNGSPLHFQFKPILTETGTTASYGKYTLYKKVTKAAASATKWEKVNTWDVGGTTETIGTGSVTYKALASVDGSAADASLDDKKFQSVVANAPLEDFTIQKRLAAIVGSVDDDAFNYAAKASYKLVCEIDNVLIFSAEEEIADARVVLNAATTSATLATTVENAETELAATDIVYTITSPSYLLSAEPKVTTIAAVQATADRVAAAKVTVSPLTGDRKTITVTVKAGTKACKGDKITITAKDAQGKPGTVDITF